MQAVPRITLQAGEGGGASSTSDRVYVRGINNNAGRYTPGTPRAFLLTSVVRF
jgi:outer membrane receptor for monomeric catechols